MKNDFDTKNANAKVSYRYHYFGMFIFGWLTYIVLFAVLPGEPITDVVITSGMGGGILYLLVGSLTTKWKGLDIGWWTVVIFTLLAYIGVVSP